VIAGDTSQRETSASVCFRTPRATHPPCTRAWTTWTAASAWAPSPPSC
jgi:hypothetical protein